MSLNRRSFLRLLVSGVAGTVASAELDIDRLLWIPGAKTFFIPNNPTISLGQIVAMEMERILPSIVTLFERDDIFYKLLDRQAPLISSREMRIPLIIKPGE
jgi:hypothetical protein